MTDYQTIPDVRKIAVLRANALGDFIFALPALQALKDAYPRAEIVLVARDWHAKFLENRPGPVARVVAVPHGGLGDEADVKVKPDTGPLMESLRQERFDLAIQMHGGGRNSNPFLLRMGARFTAGLKTPDAPPLDRWLPYIYFQNEIIRYLEVAKLVGAHSWDLQPHLSLTAADLEEAQRVVPEDIRPLIALHPGSSTPKRRWPVEKFAAVGDSLAAEGYRVAVTGTGSERELTRAVASGMRSEALDLCDRLSLGGLAGLYSRCSLVISNDSGPLHLAGAVGAPTIGLYWFMNVMTAAPPYREKHRPLLSWQTTCPACGIDCIHSKCDHPASLIESIPLEEVLSNARELLAQPR